MSCARSVRVHGCPHVAGWRVRAHRPEGVKDRRSAAHGFARKQKRELLFYPLAASRASPASCRKREPQEPGSPLRHADGRDQLPTITSVTGPHHTSACLPPPDLDNLASILDFGTSEERSLRPYSSRRPGSIVALRTDRMGRVLELSALAREGYVRTRRTSKVHRPTEGVRKKGFQENVMCKWCLSDFKSECLVI